MISVGLDIGSVAAKGVMLDGDNRHLALVPTGWSPRDAAEQLMDRLWAMSGKEREQADAIIVTGYGRIAVPNWGKTITEISCHARGVAQLYPQVRTIIDIGGQDSKVIQINSAGKVLDFSMNDKCAAGTGRFLQVTATALGLDVDELAQQENCEVLETINSMCTVFAESEIIGLLAQGRPKGGIIAGLHQSVGKRVVTMARRMGIKSEVAFTGGVAINQGVVRSLEQELKMPVIVPELCQYTGALGAALLGRERKIYGRYDE